MGVLWVQMGGTCTSRASGGSCGGWAGVGSRVCLAAWAFIRLSWEFLGLVFPSLRQGEIGTLSFLQPVTSLF